MLANKIYLTYLNNQYLQFSVSKDKKYRMPHPVFCQI